MAEVAFIPWREETAPTRDRLTLALRAEKLAANWWSNGPGDRYAPHSHGYNKVLYCAEGGITFRIEPRSEAYELRPGDRLEIPAGTLHSAVVGREGVTCVEAYR